MSLSLLVISLLDGVTRLKLSRSEDHEQIFLVTPLRGVTHLQALRAEGCPVPYRMPGGGLGDFQERIPHKRPPKGGTQCVRAPSLEILSPRFSGCFKYREVVFLFLEIALREPTMLKEYMQAALHHAKYEILTDDGTFYAEIPQCAGVYANADSLEACREELLSVLEEWILLRVYKHLPLPMIDGVELQIREAA